VSERRKTTRRSGFYVLPKTHEGSRHKIFDYLLLLLFSSS